MKRSGGDCGGSLDHAYQHHPGPPGDPCIVSGEGTGWIRTGHGIKRLSRKGRSGEDTGWRLGQNRRAAHKITVMRQNGKMACWL
jgi:hypothetical protein